MVKKCLYCGVEIPDDSVIDFCEKCGVQTFGRKMFDAIVFNMNKARDDGNLCHTARVTDFQKPETTREFR